MTDKTFFKTTDLLGLRFLFQNLLVSLIYILNVWDILCLKTDKIVGVWQVTCFNKADYSIICGNGSTHVLINNI